MRTQLKVSIAAIVFLSTVRLHPALQDPVLVSTLDIGGIAWKAVAASNYVYVADFNGGLKVVNVSNPALPSLIGSYGGNGVPSRGIAISGRYVYLTETTFGLSVIDVLTPAVPKALGSYNTTGVAQGVAVSGNYAFVADSDHGLQVIDISNPAAPARVGGILTPSVAWDVAVAGDYACVADWDGGLQVIDVSKPAAPVIIGRYDTPGTAGALAVSGKFAYVTDSQAGLHIINFADPAQPQRVGGVPAFSLSEHVALSGRFACVADYNYGIQLIDVQRPDAPQRVGGYDTPGVARGVATLGNHAYLANEARGLAIFLVPGCENCPPQFGLQPTNQLVLPGTSVTLGAMAVGADPLTYQWRFQGVDIPGATNATYSFTNVSLTNGHGNFFVVVSNEFGSVTSSNALVFVRIAPGFVTMPISQTVLQGQNATFTCVATGAPPIFYRWFRGNTPVLTSSVPFLVLTNCQSNTTIRVAATNLASGAGGVISAPATLTVLADFDSDGMADAWETLHGFDTNSAADALLDADADGMVNRHEYVGGTHPRDSASVLKLTLSREGALEFHAQSNVAYSIQHRTNLTLGSWFTFTNLSAEPQSRAVSVNVFESSSRAEGFYRVVTPPPH